MKFGIYFQLVIVCVTYIASTTADDSAIKTSLMPYIQQIRDVFQSGMLQRIVNNMADKALVGTNVSHPCLTDVERIIDDLFSGETYALQFVDADAKIPPGILQGHWAWLGNYEQCNAIESPYNASIRHTFKGKYSNVMLYRNGEPIIGRLPLAIGVCLPDSCAKADVHAIASSVTAPLSEFNVSVAFVEMDEEYPYTTGAIVFFVILGILMLLIIVGTLIDILYKPHIEHVKQLTGHDNGVFNLETGADQESVHETAVNGVLVSPLGLKKSQLPPTKPNSNGTILNGQWKETAQERVSPNTKPFIVRCLIAFSFINNTTKLLNTSTATGPLACLNGLRVLSIWWVIQGHTYSYMSIILDNGAYARKTLMGRFSFQAIANASFSVDSFFFLSGLLVAYLALKEWRKRGRLNWVYFFVHRYWRLTPVYAFVLLFYVNLVFQHLLSGPFRWMGVSPNGMGYHGLEMCRSYWWANMLYFNNLYPDYGSTSACMGWSWYLANDMQFYVIISPILIVLLYKKRILGWVVSLCLIVACVITRGALVSYYGIHKVDGEPSKHTDDPWGHDALYVHPWVRVSVYVVGILTGYILYEKKCKVRLHRIAVFAGWLVSLATALSLVYGLYGDYHEANDYPKLSLTASWFYNAFDRTAWSLCLAWVTIACVSGYGGWVNSILSWKIWAPLGRLTYTAYLVHSIVLIVFDFSATASPHFTDLSMVSIFVGFLTLSYACAYVVSMVAEAPMMQLEKCILKRD